MDSTLMDPQGNLRSMQVQGGEPVHMVQTHSQAKGQQAYDPKMVATVMAARGRNRMKYGRMGHRRGNTGKKFPTRGGLGVPGTDTDAQTSSSSPGTPGKEWASSREKSLALPYSMQDLRRKQMEDPDTSPVLKWLEKGIRPVGPEVATSSPATQHYWLYWESLKIIDGVLFQRFYRKDGTGSIPSS